MDETAEGRFEDEYVVLFVLARRVASRVLGGSAEAEDVAADTMVRAMSSWRRVRAYRAAWVSRVAFNLAIDTQRRRRRLVPMSDSYGAATIADSTERLALASALKKLPRRQREVLVLRYMAGLAGEETAAALGVSTETVKTHAQRGLAAMRADLAGSLTEAVDAA